MNYESMTLDSIFGRYFCWHDIEIKFHFSLLPSSKRCLTSIKCTVQNWLDPFDLYVKVSEYIKFTSYLSKIISQPRISVICNNERKMNPFSKCVIISVLFLRYIFSLGLTRQILLKYIPWKRYRRASLAWYPSHWECLMMKLARGNKNHSTVNDYGKLIQHKYTSHSCVA